MIHAREDYNRIQDPANKIPADEPVFLLRAQDQLACKAVSYYADLCAAAQAPEVAAKARGHSDLMAAWPVKKTPDLAALPISHAEKDGCSLGCTESCKAKEHGGASECPALPWQPRKRDTASPGPVLSKDEIRQVFLQHGFTFKDGQADLKEYVFEAAYALLQAAEYKWRSEVAIPQ